MAALLHSGGVEFEFPAKKCGYGPNGVTDFDGLDRDPRLAAAYTEPRDRLSARPTCGHSGTVGRVWISLIASFSCIASSLHMAEYYMIQYGWR